MRGAVALLFGGNALSKLIGLFREIFLAALFGTGQSIGAFRVALTGIWIPVNFVAGDALNAAFIPIYKQLKLQSKEKAATLLWSLIGLFLLISSLIALGLWLVAPIWIGLLAPGVGQGFVADASAMLRIMAIGVPFYMLATLLIFIGMAHGDFVPMAIRPSVQNIGLIGGAVAAYFVHDVHYFAWGFTASYLAFFCWVGYRIGRAGMLARPAKWEWLGTRKVLGAFWETLRPLLLIPLLLQVGIGLERAVASLIGVSAVSALDYARFVSETVLLLVSVPVAFAGLANWSGLARESVREQVQKMLPILILLGVPLSAFVGAHAHLIVEALYARGAFDARSVQATGAILLGIAVGLWAQVIGYVLIKGLNAQLRSRPAVVVVAAALGAQAIVNVALYPAFGELTLGLGNAAYGLGLMAGTMTAFRLWSEFWSIFRIVGPGTVGYLVLDTYAALPLSGWQGVIVASAFAAAYWAFFIGAIPRLRHIVNGVKRIQSEVRA